MTNYEQIIISAERYALGRMTYIVEITTNYISKEIRRGKLSKSCLKIIERDIEDAKDLGMECDKQKWLKLLEKIEEVIWQRKKHNKY